MSIEIPAGFRRRVARRRASLRRSLARVLLDRSVWLCVVVFGSAWVNVVLRGSVGFFCLFSAPAASWRSLNWVSARFAAVLLARPLFSLARPGVFLLRAGFASTCDHSLGECFNCSFPVPGLGLWLTRAPRCFLLPAGFSSAGLVYSVKATSALLGTTDTLLSTNSHAQRPRCFWLAG